MLAYKLFRVRKDGSIGSLFIDRQTKLPLGKWLRSSNHPTPGFAVRPGWHALAQPEAPHLSLKGRKWFKVSLGGQIQEFTRPAAQGGRWFLSTRMKILESL